MREYPADSKVPAKRRAFWLNLGSKAEVNELFREWKAAHAKIVSEREERNFGCNSLTKYVNSDEQGQG